MKTASLLVPALLLVPAAAYAESAATSSSTARDATAAEWALRDHKLNEASTLTGGVGLLHIQHAQGGAKGQFRLGIAAEYMSAGFLCSNRFPCQDPLHAGSTLTSDKNDHIGAHVTLAVQVTDWLEPYLSTSAYGNENAAGRPTLLQVLGDSTLGAKVHVPLNEIFFVGGAAELWLVNGTGSVGFDGSGTGARFRALGTADLRGMGKPMPLRVSLNAQYVLDNTGAIIQGTEAARGTSITRIERWGLGINRVDHIDLGIGAELFAIEERVRPFVEYNIALPNNRQNYHCRPDNPSADGCLPNNMVIPSGLTLGVRAFPWKSGFNLMAAVDVGITGVHTFIEEVRPTPPWMLYLSAGWAFDTVDRPPVATPVSSPFRKIRGFVHEEWHAAGIPDAIVSWENHPELTSLATGADGSFVTHDLPEGRYTFGVRANGYKPGRCTVTVARVAPTTPPSPTNDDVPVDCALQVLARTGLMVGHIQDADTRAPVANATVRILDAAKTELRATADASGTFRLEMASGAAQVTIDVDGYLALTERANIKPQKNNPVEFLLHKRPKNANVTIGKDEIFIKQQIQFSLDSANILPESNKLLTEIADVLVKNPHIHQVEVQGHTDNTGTPDHNRILSKDRANAVLAWLTAHGVSGDRLVARGFGETKPIVPNVTASNRAKNRRVQFIILDQGTAPSPATPPKSPPSPYR